METEILLLCDLPTWWLDWPFHERAALLLGHHTPTYDVAYKSIPVPNKALNRKSNFAITVKDVKRIIQNDKNNFMVIGVIHTHKNEFPNPSKNDLRGLPRGWIGGIYVPFKGITSWYKKEEDRV